ncbi:MAG TPA: tetratricopeptide repeat protein [Terriglobia bacterium]|nr:tetratricopeptide repeat protein [Terriglobia bacterium]
MAFNKARALQEAERALAQGRISEAAQHYLAIAENEPSDLATTNLAGDLCVRAKNIPEALRLFRRLAEAYTHDGYAPRAIAIYKKILKLGPPNLDAMLKLAGLYSGQGLAREARDLYAQSLAICQNQGLQEKALEVMRRISADEPTNIAHRLRLADLCKAAGKAEEAAKTYLDAAETALSASDHELATVAIEQAAALQPDDRRLRGLRNRLSPQDASTEDLPAAEAAPEHARELTPLQDDPEPVPTALTPEETTGALEELDPGAGSGSSEIDLSDEWETMATGQAASGGAGFDIDDLDLEIDFYLKYGMAQKAFERLNQLEQEFPGDTRLAGVRRRLRERSSGAPGVSERPAGSRGRPHEDLARHLESASAASGASRVQPDFAASLEQLVNELGSEASPPPSEGDPQAHYELGVAFREMGLVDEAIGELQKAVRRSRPGADRERLLSACRLLAICFGEKQMPTLAAKWYTRALKVPGLDSDAMLALEYDLGVAYELAGNLEAARESFLEVYAQNIEYRDVAARIRQLAASR